MHDVIGENIFFAKNRAIFSMTSYYRRLKLYTQLCFVRLIMPTVFGRTMSLLRQIMPKNAFWSIFEGGHDRPKTEARQVI